MYLLLYGKEYAKQMHSLAYFLPLIPCFIVDLNWVLLLLCHSQYKNTTTPIGCSLRWGHLAEMNHTS